MQLEGFTVAGFRSLASTDEIPVGSPTILTGANDGGKTSAIRMLEFLLGGPAPSATDYTRLDGDAQVDSSAVTGRFSLDGDDAVVLGLPDDSVDVLIRRSANRTDGRAAFEMLQQVPAHEDLRGLSEALTVADLKGRAERVGLDCPGPQGHKATFLGPLQTHAGTTEQVEEWAPIADRDVRARLPRFVLFSSTREPDPQTDIRRALQVRYGQLIANEDRLKPVRELERALQDDLIADAQKLSEHIQARCPELSTVEISPEVSFTDGLRTVGLHTGTDGVASVPLDATGSGRLRRVTLAVWEWTQELLSEEGQQQATVIAYDEPDTHLDYLRQRELLNLIRTQATTPGVSMLVATHSLNLIDRVEINDIVHLRLEDGRYTTVDRLIDEDHDEIDRYLQDVAAAMGLRNSVLLHERCFVIVEGPSDQFAVPILFRLATGLSLQAAGLALIAGDGNDGALKLARNLAKHDRPLWIIVDEDTFTNPTSKKDWSKKKLASYGIPEDAILRVGDPNELEDVFTDEQWAACSDAHWPRSDTQPWTPSQFADLRKVGTKFSNALLDLLRLESEEAPSGKTKLVATLAADLTGPEDLPADLRTKLQALLSDRALEPT